MKKIRFNSVDQFLLENYIKLGAKRCAEILGIKPSACRMRAGRLGIRIRRRPNETERVVKKYYPLIGAHGVAEMLGCCAGHVYRIASRLNLKRDPTLANSQRSETATATWSSKKFWTSERLLEVRKRYPTEGAAKLAEEFGVSISSVRYAAGRVGVTLLPETASKIISAAMKGKKWSLKRRQEWSELIRNNMTTERLTRLRSMARGANQVRAANQTASTLDRSHVLSMSEHQTKKNARRWRRQMAEFEQWAETKLQEINHADKTPDAANAVC